MRYPNIVLLVFDVFQMDRFEFTFFVGTDVSNYHLERITNFAILVRIGGALNEIVFIEHRDYLRKIPFFVVDESG